MQLFVSDTPADPHRGIQIQGLSVRKLLKCYVQSQPLRIGQESPVLKSRLSHGTLIVLHADNPGSVQQETSAYNVEMNSLHAFPRNKLLMLPQFIFFFQKYPKYFKYLLVSHQANFTYRMQNPRLSGQPSSAKHSKHEEGKESF